MVVIPTYNAGAKVYETVREARAHWAPVWVVVDGSTDGTAQGLREMAAHDPQLQVLVLERNQGKGSAVLVALEAARQAGFTHVLTMDSDGQHPADLIPAFMRASLAHADAMVLGRPVFDASAPLIRVRGRRIANFFTHVETLRAGIGDSLFGFRVYPIAPLVEVMRRGRWMRRFDFDPEVAVRLAWRGIAPINLDAPVRYLRADEGGVSHFNYLRDNILLTWMHTRLVLQALVRLPLLFWCRVRRRPPFQLLP
ncbi:MAG TPA: glycosyltransferase family 2 protein [Ramlibacter sp.]|uniref:glycosyltransferase family 2 protein n=1 Tax=Ramlibacter sp. TaxID=1917967 RepID=UPI002D488D88|nr:glycosyltransferase family 2 protein [Ramlibacter sp.]HZY19972.1 glycosyltransferase family 2 protein [Ramlibacter sp.]